ncbi:MAG: TonB family protein [Flavobacteriales bacterium]|nr:MAG: TonB family protein [Flavobacteriales bacterium]
MSWAHYLLQVNIYLVIFYCFYKLLLDKETYFVLNRIYLIASGALAFAIPFLRFEWFSKHEVTQQIYVGVDQLNDYVTQVSVVNDTATDFNWGNLIVSIYLLGVVIFTAKFIYQLLAVKKLLNNISKGAAFSFLSKKVVASDVPEAATVNLHEEVHVKQLHTIDVLFFEFIGIFNWFNPIVYVYKKTVKNIHEFLADEAAAKFQGDKETYSLLLLSQAFGVSPSSLTNGFFTKSLIKKRIYMLHKERSTKAAVLKYGLFVPIFAVTLVLSSATIRKNDHLLNMAGKIPLNEVNTVVETVMEAPLSVVNLAPPPAPKQNEEKLTSLTEVSVIKNSSPDADKKANWSAFYKHLASHIKYPAQAADNRTQGLAVVNFQVNNGKIANITVSNRLGEGLEEEIVKHINSFDSYENKDGNYSLKVDFRLVNLNRNAKNEKIAIPNGYTPLDEIVIMGFAPEEENDQKIYSFQSMEVPPEFPGGIAKFYEFLGKTIQYPTLAADNDIQGNVFVSFVVERDGSLNDIKIDRKLGYGTDEEALRVLKLSRRWNPGIQNGRPVRVKYNIPIKFTLNNKFKTTDMALNTNGKDPLVLVDNEVREIGTIAKLESNNIQSMSVLKGTSATALYGKSAENGAVIITSKRASKPTVTLNNRN